RGVRNFGDERLYQAVLKDYSSQLLASVHRIESFQKSEDKAALTEEVELLLSSAAYLGADRLSLAARALLQTLSSRQGNEAALCATLCEQA
ncbi:unnamed protein product, partial [Effrenium voratum]